MDIRLLTYVCFYIKSQPIVSHQAFGLHSNKLYWVTTTLNESV
jgi:hypothetical protein